MNREQTLCCSDVEELLPLIAEGLIDVENDESVFEHLAECEHCQQQLQEHDTITLAMSHGREIQPAQQRTDVIHFRLSRPIAAAAAMLLLAFGSALSYMSQQSVEVDQPNALTANEPETQILQVLAPKTGDDVPLIIIRHQDQTMVIRQDQIDSGTDNEEIKAAVPVHVRY